MSIAAVRIGADNCAYVLADGRAAAVVDPGDAHPVSRFLQQHGLSLSHILLTHMHGDHTAGAAALKRETRCRVIGPSGGGLSGGVDERAREGATWAIGSYEVRALETPGHTAGDISYHVPALHAVFTGDTMFVAGCGRLFGGSAETMWRSLQKIAALGDDTLVYPGHDYTEENLRFAVRVEPENYAVNKRLLEIRSVAGRSEPAVPSPMGLERMTNPFLRAGDPSMKKALGMERATDAQVFAELRKRKDRF
ncbi:MAG: hydroxyacylglutathione hydrolase [Chitinivibrionales bacterium]|nr:hydroxyacylglutathione hydrolase [Chitinivibrionales bacterium]MBD3395361.1 hydroxyacylglutathione hydrolase [Chitinivibrionales bacterium]